MAPRTALRCAEEVAGGGALAASCVSIAITGGLLAAYLPPEAREELFGCGRGIAAGVWTPVGPARRSTAASVGRRRLAEYPVMVLSAVRGQDRPPLRPALQLAPTDTIRLEP